MEQKAKAVVVWLILNGRVEEAIEVLAREHRVRVPKIQVGLPKRSKMRALGCYTGKNRTISVFNSDVLKNPFVILHEFYHHLRTSADAKHRGTEKLADAFARDFLRAYETIALERSTND